MEDKTVEAEVAKLLPQAPKQQAEKPYLGMHQGTVKGKSFESSRRSRKTHAQRKAQRASTKS